MNSLRLEMCSLFVPHTHRQQHEHRSATCHSHRVGDLHRVGEVESIICFAQRVQLAFGNAECQRSRVLQLLGLQDLALYCAYKLDDEKTRPAMAVLNEHMRVSSTDRGPTYGSGSSVTLN